MAEKKNIIWTRGRRKSSVARVRLFAGIGAITVNTRTLENYFPRPTSRMRILEPFEATETTGQYDVLVSVEGGGLSAQADAVRLGISRALITVTETRRPVLRKGGMVSREPREVERQQYWRAKASERPHNSKT